MAAGEAAYLEYGVGATDVGAGRDGSLWLSNVLYQKTSGWATLSLPEPAGAASLVEGFTVADGEVWAAATSELNDVEFNAVVYHGA